MPFTVWDSANETLLAPSPKGALNVRLLNVLALLIVQVKAAASALKVTL